MQQSTKRIERDPFEHECLHCALSVFLNEWRRRHGTAHSEHELLLMVVEVASDIASTQETEAERARFCASMLKKALVDALDIKNGTYKPDAVTDEEIEAAGGIQ